LTEHIASPAFWEDFLVPKKLVVQNVLSGLADVIESSKLFEVKRWPIASWYKMGLGREICMGNKLA